MNPIETQLLALLPALKDNTSIVSKLEALNLDSIDNGILIIVATWSVQSIINCTQTIRRLYTEKYSGEIIIFDSDSITPEHQISLLGELTHGRGESFVIQDGQIIERFQ